MKIVASPCFSTLLPLAFALVFGASSSAILADEYHHHHHERGDGDYAEVVSVKPIKEDVQVSAPHRECRQEEVTQDSGNNGHGGAVVGAIAGGALGNAAGHNTQSRRLDTIAGAIAGGIIGEKMSESSQQQQTTTVEERCRTRREVEYEQRVVGYDVTYRYFDREFTTRMDHDPGNEIRVSVDVRPAE